MVERIQPSLAKLWGRMMMGWASLFLGAGAAIDLALVEASQRVSNWQTKIMWEYFVSKRSASWTLTISLVELRMLRA